MSCNFTKVVFWFLIFLINWGHLETSSSTVLHTNPQLVFPQIWAKVGHDVGMPTILKNCPNNWQIHPPWILHLNSLAFKQNNAALIAINMKHEKMLPMHEILCCCFNRSKVITCVINTKDVKCNVNMKWCEDSTTYITWNNNHDDDK